MRETQLSCSELRQGGVTVTRMFPSETHCTEAVAQSARVRNLESAFRHLKRLILLWGTIF